MCGPFGLFSNLWVSWASVLTFSAMKSEIFYFNGIVKF